MSAIRCPTALKTSTFSTWTKAKTLSKICPPTGVNPLDTTNIEIIFAKRTTLTKEALHKCKVEHLRSAQKKGGVEYSTPPFANHLADYLRLPTAFEEA